MLENGQPHPVYRALMPYVVALFGIRQEGATRFEVRHRGSGTLITINNVFGILTAGHVIQQLEPFETWAYASFNSSGEHSRMHSFPKNTCQFERLGNDYENTAGPDIGFIRLPDDIAAKPSDEAMFYNITQRYNNARANDGQVRAPLPIHAIAGVIGQASNMIEQLDHSTEVETTMLVSQVAILDRREHLEMDYYEVRVGNVEGLPKPTSYQGVSGGPLFATKECATIDERILIGVAFRQSEPDENGERTVLCHGWKSIYDTMCPIITLAYADPATFIKLNDLNPDGTPKIDTEPNVE